MAFDAGSILGHLGLDISEYGKGMLEATEISKLFPNVVLEFLENPLLGFIELTKEVSEAVTEMGEKLFDMVKEVGNTGAAIGLMSEKAGVSVKFFSELSKVAETVNVSSGELGNAFKFLQRATQELASGEAPKITVEAFQRIGINAAFARDHLGDMEGMFNSVRTGLDRLGTQTEKAATQQEIFSKGGEALIPVMNMTKEHMEELIDTFTKLGVVETDETAKAGRGFVELQSKAEAALGGIAMVASAPILDYLEKHQKEITAEIIKDQKIITDEIHKFYEYLKSPPGQELIARFEALGKSVETLGEDILKAFGIETLDKFESKLKGITAEIDKIVKGLTWAVDHVNVDKRIENAVGATSSGKQPQSTPAPSGEGFWHGVWRSITDHSNTAPQYRGADGQLHDMDAKDNFSWSKPQSNAGQIGDIHVHVGAVDPAATAGKVASAIAPKILDALRRQQRGVKAGAIADQVLAGMGGQA